MTSSTVQARRDAPPMDYETAADVVAQVFRLADDVRADLAEGNVASLATLVATTASLGRLTAGWQVDDLEEIAGRLWMVAR